MNPVTAAATPLLTPAPVDSAAARAPSRSAAAVIVPRLLLARTDTPPPRKLVATTGGSPIGILGLASDCMRSIGDSRGAAFIRTTGAEESEETDSVYSDAASLDLDDLDSYPFLDEPPTTTRGRRRSTFLHHGFGLEPPSMGLRDIVIMIERFYAKKATATVNTKFVFFQPEAPFVPVVGDIAPVQQWKDKVTANLAPLFTNHTEATVRTLVNALSDLTSRDDKLSEKLTHTMESIPAADRPPSSTYHAFRLPNGAIIIYENERFAHGTFKRVYRGYYIHLNGDIQKIAVTIGRTILKEARFLIDHHIDHPNMIKPPIACFEYKDEEIGIWHLYPRDFVAEIAEMLSKAALEPKDLERVLVVARQVLLALKYLLSLNFLHLDIKPSNILIGEDGTPALADLGLVMNILEATALRRDIMLVTEAKYTLEGGQIPPVFDFDHGVILFPPLEEYMKTHQAYPTYAAFKAWMAEKVTEGIYATDETSEANPMVLSVKNFLQEVRNTIGGIKVKGTDCFMPASARFEGMINDTNDCFAVGEMLRISLSHAKFRALIAGLGDPVKERIEGLIQHLIDSADLEKRAGETGAMAARTPASTEALALIDELIATIHATVAARA